ncbi:MAG: hypothetical protein CL711_03055 [Chloroflexi bacterium]|jgi:hypothetical protein|nr:MAG: hypothetical protein EGP06_04680 [SAR202 cluster bacterium]MAX12416.1 hypothetical protein [Chloroflexota bacterium]|tara:strand:- start:2212 stop:3060 length:849 start_codon:yes stop_codon:yes gene_type:complete
MVNQGFFGNISNTIHLMKSCVNVLKKDKELVFFPIMAAIFVIVLLGIIYSTGGITFSDNPEEQGSIIPLAILIFGANFIIVFFNSALISAALERLRGGDPNISSGLSHAFKHVHHIFLWSIIVTIMALIFAAIRSSGRNRGMMGQIMTELFASFLQAGWAMMTFFVVPIIVSENLGPISAIKRSSGLFKQTWGNQVAANFGFGIFQILALLASGAIGWIFGLASPTFGMIVGVLCASISVSIIYTLEGIYKAALYEFAMGEKPLEFEQQDLRTAYRASASMA